MDAPELGRSSKLHDDQNDIRMITPEDLITTATPHSTSKPLSPSAKPDTFVALVALTVMISQVLSRLSTMKAPQNLPRENLQAV